MIGHQQHQHHAASPNTVTTEPTSTAGHAHEGKKGLASLLALVNMLLFLTTLAMAAYMFDEWADQRPAPLRLFSLDGRSGKAAVAMLALTLLSSTVGVATMIMALVHGKKYTEGARMASLGSNLISWALVSLAAGFSIKYLIRAVTGNRYGNIAIAIAAFNIALFCTMLAYLLALKAFKNKDEYRYSTYPSTTTTGAGGLPTHHHGHKYAAGHEEPRALDARAAHA